ncbi:hypothetical protein P152DRAFT_393681 [Eremomyces bilateralis CBS 781.70]|uniref:Mitochondrial import inner membrane translocase subunit TIM50 n=1 Tax=Eremomyces bilateralis CBS 781.70 TaxID=1392243 RepID=A0A6G1G947_9PEZI|nr:uncharacterized protein P152DRAFT_393681 [Eremomyces bilateralis CBS 781.70]KAF1814625.1 hypothetical protein P152DRAFT_393681 [Eremomyces bilateralis CBS 781.70]
MPATVPQYDPDDFRGVPGTVNRDILGAAQRKIPPPEFPTLKPSPTKPYLAQTTTQSIRRSEPQPLLIVTDLNGTLIYRGGRGKQNFVPRPNLDEFLSQLFSDDSFRTMVWTSARPENAAAILARLLTPEQRSKLVAEWARDKLGLNHKQYNQKVQVYKRLSAIWRDKGIQKSHPRAAKGEKWGPHNTVLIDDSREKASSEPYNLICIPEFVAEKKAEGKPEGEAEARVLMKVLEYLDEAKYWSNISAFIRDRPFAMEDVG